MTSGLFLINFLILALNTEKFEMLLFLFRKIFCFFGITFFDNNYAVFVHYRVCKESYLSHSKPSNVLRIWTKLFVIETMRIDAILIHLHMFLGFKIKTQ